jgi:hypothetical protein
VVASPGKASLSAVCPAQEAVRSSGLRLAAAVFGPLERFHGKRAGSSAAPACPPGPKASQGVTGVPGTS